MTWTLHIEGTKRNSSPYRRKLITISRMDKALLKSLNVTVLVSGSVADAPCSKLLGRRDVRCGCKLEWTMTSDLSVAGWL